MADARGLMRGERARAGRSAKTIEALSAAATTADPARRHVLMVEVAELNVWVVEAVVASMARRYRCTDLDRRTLAECARRAYRRAVLRLDPRPDLDLVTQVVPVVRDAVRRCARTQVAAGDRAPPL